MAEYIAEDGTLITEEMIDQWVNEAEQGFPHSVITPITPLAWRAMKQQADYAPMKPHAIRMTDMLWQRVKKAAKEQNIDTSTYVRQAIARALTEDARKTSAA